MKWSRNVNDFPRTAILSKIMQNESPEAEQTSSKWQFLFDENV